MWKGGDYRKQNGECYVNYMNVNYMTESPTVCDMNTRFIGGSGESEAGRTRAISERPFEGIGNIS